VLATLASFSIAAGLCGALLLGGCRDGSQMATGGTSTAPAPAPAQEVIGHDRAGADEPRLADAPTIDLLANRHRWHLHRKGLIVPFAGEGLRKYSQEYSQPWGEVIDHDGRAGRTLARPAATLTVPWHHGDEATALLWVHGLVDGQRVQLEVNGRHAGASAARTEWSALQMAIPRGALRQGENQIRVHVARAGRVAGTKSYGLFHALELVPGPTDAIPRPPPLTPVARARHGAEKPALTGLPRMVLHVEVPRGAWLQVDTGGEEGARLRARARTVDGESQVLIDTTARPGAWTRHRVSLAQFADRLVELELSADNAGAWAEPVIALEEAKLAPAPPTYDNLVLVVVDALRSDRLAVYGKTRVRTPRITAEAEKRGVVFLHNQAASPSSPPSHGSIQTGMIPRVHGVTGDRAQLAPGTPMLSTQLGAAGVATAYFGNNPFGMARLEKPGKWTAFHQPSREGKGHDCTALVPEMLAFAGEQKRAGRRFFISSLPYEPHTPYRYHRGISDRFFPGPWGPPVGKHVDGGLLSSLSSGRTRLSDAQWEQLRALYDGEVEYFDACFGRLIDGLAEIGAGRDTAVVLTSDHGEGMFEHGHMGHAFGHYAELGNVPLVVMADRLTPSSRKLTTVTSHLDIAPTVLQLMGVEPDRRVQGHSLIPVIRRQGAWPPRVVPLEYGRSYALRARRWKLIVDYSGTESLFDLESDPTEQTDLVGKNHMAHRYLRDLAGFYLAHRTRWTMARWGPLNDHAPAFAENVER